MQTLIIHESTPYAFWSASLSLCFQAFCSLSSRYKCVREFVPRVDFFSLETLVFNFWLALWCQRVHVSQTDYGPVGGLFIHWRSWECKSVKAPVIVQDWSQLLALGCKFLVRERQSSLLRAELTLFLWVKRKQSLKIYLGEKPGFWLFTLQRSWEKEEFVFNFAVLGEWKVCELGKKGFVERTIAVCSRCSSGSRSAPRWEVFNCMRSWVRSRGRTWNAKGGRSREWMCRTGSEWDAHEAECKCYFQPFFCFLLGQYNYLALSVKMSHYSSWWIATKIERSDQFSMMSVSKQSPVCVYGQIIASTTLWVY